MTHIIELRNIIVQYCLIFYLSINTFVCFPKSAKEERDKRKIVSNAPQMPAEDFSGVTAPPISRVASFRSIVYFEDDAFFGAFGIARWFTRKTDSILSPVISSIIFKVAV